MREEAGSSWFSLLNPRQELGAGVTTVVRVPVFHASFLESSQTREVAGAP
jgi:hypothetical protein